MLYYTCLQSPDHHVYFLYQMIFGREKKDVNICHCVSSDKIEHVVVPRKYFLSDILLSWIICYRTACLNMLQHACFPMFTNNKHANISKPRPNSHPFPLDYSQTNKHVSRCMWRLNIPWCIWCTYTTTPTPTRCEQRDAFKNITFPQLLFAGGNACPRDRYLMQGKRECVKSVHNASSKD